MILQACDASWDRAHHVPDRKGHDRRYSLDASLIRSELGYRVDFEQGLRKIVAWYHENRVWRHKHKPIVSQLSRAVAPRPL